MSRLHATWNSARRCALSQRERMAGSPLCDAKDLAWKLESAYFEMFERWMTERRKINRSSAVIASRLSLGSRQFLLRADDTSTYPHT